MQCNVISMPSLEQFTSMKKLPKSNEKSHKIFICFSISIIRYIKDN